MNIKDLKYKIGSQAEGIIASSLNLTKKGNKYIGQCPRGGHKKNNPVYEWKSDHFFCYDCHTTYDIIDFYREKEGLSWFAALCDTAGVKAQAKVFPTIEPVIKTTSTKGIEYLQKRGISPVTIELYKVRADDKWIYFNYATPDNKLLATKYRSIVGKEFNATTGGTSILYGLHLMNKQKVLIICEGEIDAMSMYEIALMIGAEDTWLCSSLPQGAGSLQKVIDNCSGQMDMFEQIIIVADNDKAGKKFKEEARNKLSEYDLFELALPDSDVNEYLLNADNNLHEIKNYLKILLPPLLAVGSKCVEDNEELFHFKSGFPTLDKNWDGLQGGWLTLLNGKRNSGKTLIAKQIIVASAKQEIPSYYFTGEEKHREEENKLAMIAHGQHGASVPRPNTINGAERFIASKDAMTSYNTQTSKYIKVIDFTMTGANIFEQILPDMKRAIRHGVKLFVLDNLMILTNGTDDATAKERVRQIKIIGELKKFVNVTNTHVVLIVHPNKGGEDISGATEIQNLADGIINLYRFNNSGNSELDEKLLQPLKDRFHGRNTSSLLRFSKGRDNATFYEMGLEFNAHTGRLLDSDSDMDKDNYYLDGYYAVSRIASADVPDYDKQHGDE